MVAQVIDEFQVLGKYRVMVLDQDASCAPQARYRINGQIYDPVNIHRRSMADTIPHNYIAVKSTKSFKGSAVEFV